MSSARRFDLIFGRTEEIAPNVKIFYFSLRDKVSFIPGQYLQLTMSHDADEKGSSRFFTISSAPHEKEIMITTRISANASSFKKKMFALQPGEVVGAFGPMGKFVLED